MRTLKTMRKWMALPLVALSIGAASANTGKQIPANTSKPTAAKTIKQPPSDTYKEGDLKVDFVFQPRQQIGEGHCIIARIKNLSKTKILRPDTDHWIPDNSPSAREPGFFVPRIKNVTDNFGNVFRVGSITPRLMPETGGIYPGETKEIALRIYEKLIPTTTSLKFFVEENVVGNSKWFEVCVPVQSVPEGFGTAQTSE